MVEPKVYPKENSEHQVVHYNTIEQTSYAGRLFINIQFPAHEGNIFKSHFRAGSTLEIPLTPMKGSEQADDVSIKNEVIKALTSSFSDQNLFPNLQKFNGVIRFVEKPGTADSKSTLEAISTEPISHKLSKLDVDEVVSMIQAGKRLRIYRSMYGTLTYDYIQLSDFNVKKILNFDDISYGPRSFDTYQRYIDIKSINRIHPPNGLSLSCTSGFCITVRGTSRPKHEDRSYTDNRHHRHELPAFIHQVQKVTVSFRTVPDAGSFEGTATQDRPGSWDDWSFSHDIFSDDASGAGQKNFVIIATAHYEHPIDPEEIAIGIMISFTGLPPGPQENVPPTVRIMSPIKGENIVGDYNGLQLCVEGTASHSPRGSGVRNVEVTIDDDIGLYSEATPKWENNWSNWSTTRTIFTSGTHTITARCTDYVGNVNQDRTSINVTITPRSTETNLLLVERYRLSSFSGEYHPGRIINTITLMPGEKKTVSINAFTNSENKRKEEEQTSCILDSFTQNSSDNFEDFLAGENSDNQDYDQNFKPYFSTDGEAGWGFGSCKITSGIIGGTNSAREEFAKNVSNALHEHVSMVSAKRNIQVNTDCEMTFEQKGEDQEQEKGSKKCEIINVNLNRTLKLAFRQVSREFISLLHLIDVRVAILRREYIEEKRCLRITYREVTLPQMDAFLDEVLLKDVREIKGKVTEFILNQLYNIFDYKDDQRSFAEDKSFKDSTGRIIHGSNYLHVRKDLVSKYVNPIEPHIRIFVPGIILSAIKNVLRTEVILVEPFLGYTDTLDDYSKEALEKIKLRNELNETEISRNNLGIKLIEKGDKVGAKIFKEVFPCCKPPIFSLWPPKDEWIDRDTEVKEDENQ